MFAQMTSGTGGGGAGDGGGGGVVSCGNLDYIP